MPNLLRYRELAVVHYSGIPVPCISDMFDNRSIQVI